MKLRKMFLAQENICTKKRFQKPNILRRKPSQRRVTNESPTAKSGGSKSQIEKSSETLLNEKCNQYASMDKLISNSNAPCEGGNIIDLYQSDINIQFDQLEEENLLSSGNKESPVETINVESFLNNSEVEQIVTQADIECELNEMRKQEWCLDFINNAQEIIIEDIDGSHLGSLRLASTPKLCDAVPLSAVIQEHHPHRAAAPAPAPSPSPGPAPASALAPAPAPNLTLEYLPSSTMNFKCDSPNCTKWFRSQHTLDKHKATHDKTKVNRQVVIACPVRKVHDNGTEEPCPMYCHVKEDMVKHLNEDHSPEDAMYICSECGRRFYWASGLRAHSRSHAAAARAPLTCAWAGCGRAFRQPCRLREHMRAHTGDKPYPCRYPNCGWSFRTASKLLRHARRHTGERRHACGSCARAFRRPEHLRHHLAKRRCVRYKYQCALHGCRNRFTNLDALKIHRQKVHKELSDELSPAPEVLTLEFASPDEPPEVITSYEPPTATPAPAPAPVPSPAPAHAKTDEIYYVNLHTSDLDVLPGSSDMNISLLPHPDLREEAITMETPPPIPEMHVSDDSESDILVAVTMESIVGKSALEEAVMSSVDNTEVQTEIFGKTGLEAESFSVGKARQEVDAFVGKAGGVMDAFVGKTGGVVDAFVGKVEGMVDAFVGKAGGVRDAFVGKTGLEVEESGSPRAARTHCAWPFDPAPARSPPTPPSTFRDNDNDNAQYALEDDSQQAALGSGSERSTYTIRSDLFLHGNILHNDDSEQIAGAESSSLLVVPHPADPDLGLLDHPTIDLMQEELMYTDEGVDESSFRVFLLNGEELT